MKKIFFVILLSSIIPAAFAQSGNFIGKFDYPEVMVGLTVPVGQFGNDNYTVTNQLVGYAENGFVAGLAYHIGFGKSIFGWYLNLSYRQMPNKRFNDIENLDPPLREIDESGVLSRQGQYIFISFLNGPVIQLNTGKVDPYIQGFFGPSYVSGSRTVVKGTASGSDYTYLISGTVGLGRGGEVGLVFANNFRIGLSYVTYGTLQLALQEGSDIFSSSSVNVRQPVDFWQLGLSYTWKKD